MIDTAFLADKRNFALNVDSQTMASSPVRIPAAEAPATRGMNRHERRKRAKLARITLRKRTKRVPAQTPPR